MNNVIKRAEIRSGDIYSIFNSQLFSKLKDRIDASVYVSNEIVDNSLIVRINKGQISYSWKMENFGMKLLAGLDSSFVADTIVSDYKKFLLKIFFYEYRR